MKILIISAGRYPIPATKGGAVSTLINHLVDNNEKQKLADMEVSSPYEERAAQQAGQLQHCRIRYIKTPWPLKKIENAAYAVANRIMPQKNWTQLKSSLSFLWYLWKNALLLKRENYDCVIVENTARLYLCLKICGNKARYRNKVVYHLHNEPQKLAGCRDIIAASNAILCISQYIKDSILAPDSPLHIQDEQKVRVLYNRIDTTKFYPFSRAEKEKCRKLFGLSDQDRVIVFSGRIDAEKGIRELLKALSYVKTENVKILVVGSSFYGMNVKTAFEREIFSAAQKLGNRIVFTGFIPYENMPQAYNAADIAVLPSMWNEPAGLTILEAMACGTPVITTRSGGIPEYAGEECAILLERNEAIVQTLADQIDALFASESRRKELAKNARNHVVQNHDASVYLREMLALLEKRK